MPKVSLSQEADADVEAIVDGTLQRWGINQSRAYVIALRETFKLLAVFPDFGRDVGYLHQGYRRIDARQHAIFYRKNADGVLIIRVLHRSMDAKRHL